MTYPVSGIILAGGLSKRFSGQNKAFLKIQGQKIIDSIYNLFKDTFEEIILVSNDPVQYLDWDLLIITDHYPHRSSLTGIHAGLFAAGNPFAFFVACDTPFIKKEILDCLLARIQNQLDIIIPQTDKGLEPLFAVYSKRCLKPIEQQLKDQRFKIQKFFNKVKMLKIPQSELIKHDPNLISFFNINHPKDFEYAQILGETCQ